MILHIHIFLNGFHGIKYEHAHCTLHTYFLKLIMDMEIDPHQDENGNEIEHDLRLSYA